MNDSRKCRRARILSFAAALAISLGLCEAAGAATVTGLVQDPDGAPLAGVEVLLRAAGTTAVTDEGGRFALTGVAPGSLNLFLDVQNAYDQQNEAGFDFDRDSLTLQPDGSVAFAPEYETWLGILPSFGLGWKL